MVYQSRCAFDSEDTGIAQCAKFANNLRVIRQNDSEIIRIPLCTPHSERFDYDPHYVTDRVVVEAWQHMPA